MKTLFKVFCLGVIITLTSFSCEKEDLKTKHAEAIISGTGSEIQVQGRLMFTQLQNKAVKMVLQINVPSKANESVAVHIHEHGMCGNGGADAHGHWNPTGTAHGKWGEGEYHAGDIGNISLDAEGNGTLTLITEHWSIGGEESTNIIDKGIIVHSGIDDYTSQPSGNAGPRIGCGVIELK